MKKVPDLYLGIVGSRRRCSLYDRQLVFKIIVGFIEMDVIGELDRKIVVVSGGCRTGADSYAEEAARANGLNTLIHPVQKDPPIRNKKDFRDRAFARNRLVARDSDLLFALVSEDRTGGTEDTIEHMKQFGKPVWIVDGSGIPYLEK